MQGQLVHVTGMFSLGFSLVGVCVGLFVFDLYFLVCVCVCALHPYVHCAGRDADQLQPRHVLQEPRDGHRPQALEAARHCGSASGTVFPRSASASSHNASGPVCL